MPNRNRLGERKSSGERDREETGDCPGCHFYFRIEKV
jgi:hypothetical protein